eukprot:161036-Pelagomonas_calceolata.AAC.1
MHNAEKLLLLFDWPTTCPYVSTLELVICALLLQFLLGAELGSGLGAQRHSASDRSALRQGTQTWCVGQIIFLGGSVKATDSIPGNWQA